MELARRLEPIVYKDLRCSTRGRPSAKTVWLVRTTYTRYTSEVKDLAGLPPFRPPLSGFGGLGVTLLGWVADHWGLPTVLWICALMPLLGFVVAWFLPTPRTEIA